MKVKRIWVTLMLLTGSLAALAQSDSLSKRDSAYAHPYISEEDEVYEFFAVHEKAEYVGKEKSINAYIVKNVKYPSIAKENDVQGRVLVQFTVNEDSTISEVKTIGNTIGYGLEQEAMRVIKSTSGHWKPATIRDKPVKMRMILPFMFKLNP